jgi:hypothetical protein
MLFKEIIAVCSETGSKHLGAKFTVTDSQNRWYIFLPLGFKGLIFPNILAKCM